MRTLFAVAIALALASCNATIPKLPDSGTEVPARSQAAKQAFPTGGFSLIYLPTKGVGSDTLTLTGLKSGAGSVNSRSLADMLSRNGTGQLRVVVSGPNDSIAALTLIESLLRNKGQLAPAVEIAFVGGSEYLNEMTAAASAASATLIHVQYPKS